MCTSLPTGLDELNEFVGDSVTTVTVREAIAALYPGGIDVPAANVLRIARQQCRSFKAVADEVDDGVEAKEVIDYRKLKLPDGFYRHLRSAITKDGKKRVASNKNYYFSKSKVGKQDQGRRGKKRASSAKFKNYDCLANVYRAEGLEMPMKRVKKRRKITKTKKSK